MCESAWLLPTDIKMALKTLTALRVKNVVKELKQFLFEDAFAYQWNFNMTHLAEKQLNVLHKKKMYVDECNKQS